MVGAALEGDMVTAREKHYKILPLIELIFREGNPCGVKALMELLGHGDSNLRLPLIPATEALVADLRKAVKQL